MTDASPGGESRASLSGMYFEEEDPEGHDLLAHGGSEDSEGQGDSNCGFEF